MKIVVIANVDMQKEFENKGIAEGIELHFEVSTPAVNTEADAYFFLLDEDELISNKEWMKNAGSIVFVNAVHTTLKGLPHNVVRINGWAGFIQRSIVEVSASEINKDHAIKILEALNWRYQLVPDVEGMISAKVISMVVNEAYFALGDEVSTKEDIDTAMKLGTNYPYGPFEWSKIIGLKNIYTLLESLSKIDERYKPAPFLLNETSH